jgi:hypothetical protein
MDIKANGAKIGPGDTQRHTSKRAQHPGRAWDYRPWLDNKVLAGENAQRPHGGWIIGYQNPRARQKKTCLSLAVAMTSPVSPHLVLITYI